MHRSCQLAHFLPGGGRGGTPSYLSPAPPGVLPSPPRRRGSAGAGLGVVGGVALLAGRRAGGAGDRHCLARGAAVCLSGKPSLVGRRSGGRRRTSPTGTGPRAEEGRVLREEATAAAGPERCAPWRAGPPRPCCPRGPSPCATCRTRWPAPAARRP